MAKTSFSPPADSIGTRDMDPLSLLVVDDDPSIIDLVSAFLAGKFVSVVGTTTTEGALSIVETIRPRIVLVDLHLKGGANGIDLMALIHRIDPEIRVYILTGDYKAESAVKAIQDGAEDYLLKPVSITLLQQHADQWIDDEQRRKRAIFLERELLAASTIEGIVGRSPALLDLLTKVRRVAPHCATALVTGETGTGKEALARAIHAWSKRKGPFVVCNCAAIVETLFEAELFGHRRGSFTGATADRKGLVESAEGGTLFLDEIGEVPGAMQAKLLRFLQTHEVHPVGAVSLRTVDVRVVAATNRDLRTLTATGGFREDLFYRLSMVELKLPSLRERKEDIPFLIRHFLEINSEQYSKPGLRLARRTEALLLRYNWPGNIRELENCLAYASMLTADAVIDSQSLPDYMTSGPATSANRVLTLAELEFEHATKVLGQCDGNRAKAAEVLGIGRATLYRLLARTREALAPYSIPSLPAPLRETPSALPIRI